MEQIVAEAWYQRYLKQIIRGVIWVYQHLIRPCMPSCCRFYPSCSEYALQALTSYGVGKSLWLILRRLLRCHPLAKGGLDPVP